MRNISTDVPDYQDKSTCNIWGAIASILGSDSGNSQPAPSTKSNIMDGFNDPATLGQNAIEKLSSGQKIDLNSLGVAYDALSQSYKPDASAMSQQLADVSSGSDAARLAEQAAAKSSDNVAKTDAATKPAPDTGKQLTNAVLNSDKEAKDLFNMVQLIRGSM